MNTRIVLRKVEDGWDLTGTQVSYEDAHSTTAALRKLIAMTEDKLRFLIAQPADRSIQEAEAWSELMAAAAVLGTALSRFDNARDHWANRLLPLPEELGGKT